MELGEIDFSRLERVRYRGGALQRAIAKNAEPTRKIYVGPDLVYKIWDRRSSLRRRILIDGNIIKVRNTKGADGREQLLGFLCKLFDETTCPAFVEHIYADDKLVGYVTRKGVTLSPEDTNSAACVAFVNALIKRSLDCGYVYRDLHPANLIWLPDGRISLIDLEIPIADLPSLDLNVEIATTGSLRLQRLSQYRRFILDYFDRRVVDKEMDSARQRLRNRPVPFKGRVMKEKRELEESLSAFLPRRKRDRRSDGAAGHKG